MLKKNKKGFALVETLIVSVFVATIFTIMYTNFFPMFGEYERREAYDDIDSIYSNYLIKRMFENTRFRENISYENYKTTLRNKSYMKIYSVDYNAQNNCTDSDENNINTDLNEKIKLACQYLTSNTVLSSSGNTTLDYCVNVMTATRVSKIYLTNYTITDLKRIIKKGDVPESEMNMQMQEYINSLPYYKINNSECRYRVIVEYIKEANKVSGCYKKTTYSFSTIGVKI